MFSSPPAFAAVQWNRVATVDSSTATASQACYWSGTTLECTSTNPTITVTGLVGIGSTSPTVSLDLSQKTDAVSLPVGTTGQRPTGVNGMIRYNSALPGLEAYVNGVWSTLQSSGTTSGVLGVANGGTGDSTLTAHGVIVGEGTSPLAATSAGAIDTVLVGNGSSSDPTFSASPTLSGTITDLQSIGATSTDGMVLQNTTTAAAGAQQWSPRLHYSGRGWETGTSASQSVDMITELQTVQGTANPSGNLTWSSSVNGAGYSPLMTLTSGGNVGIGTTSPSGALHIYGNDSTGSDEIWMTNTASGGRVWRVGDGAYVANGIFSITDDTAGASRIAINSTGNVGIGTASPASLLNLSAPSNNSVLTFNRTDISASSTIGLYNGGTDIGGLGGGATLNFGFPGAAGTSPIINFRMNATNIMTILGTGNVGIGTSSPGGTLDVEGGTSGSGNGTNITLAAQNGKASGNTNGGNIILTPGAANGTGTAGAVGIGTSSPAASVKADINGMVKVAGTGSEPCTAAQVGSMRYNPTGNYFELCSYP